MLNQQQDIVYKKYDTILYDLRTDFQSFMSRRDIFADL